MRLNMEKKNTWETYSSKQLKELEKINTKYRDFLDNGKTERECIDTMSIPLRSPVTVNLRA